MAEAKTVTVRLTPEEAHALRMAAEFGPPHRPVDALTNAILKVKAAEGKAR